MKVGDIATEILIGLVALITIVLGIFSFAGFDWVTPKIIESLKSFSFIIGAFAFTFAYIVGLISEQLLFVVTKFLAVEDYAWFKLRKEFEKLPNITFMRFQIAVRSTSADQLLRNIRNTFRLGRASLVCFFFSTIFIYIISNKIASDYARLFIAIKFIAIALTIGSLILWIGGANRYFQSLAIAYRAIIEANSDVEKPDHKDIN